MRKDIHGRARSTRRILSVAVLGLIISVLTSCGSKRRDSANTTSVASDTTAAISTVVNNAAATSAANDTKPKTEPVTVASTAATETSAAKAVPDSTIASSPSTLTPAASTDLSRSAYGSVSLAFERSALSRVAVEPPDPSGKGFLKQFAAAGEVATTDNAPQLPPRGKPVQVKGEVWGGTKVTVNAERLADGTIAFIDSSQPGADRASGQGLSIVYDGASITSLDQLPGSIATMKEGDKPDRDVLTAAWAAQNTLDYFRTEHGQRSFDGNGAPIRSVVHIPSSVDGCGAWTAQDLYLFTGPCSQDGKQLFETTVDVSTTASFFALQVFNAAAPNQRLFGGQAAMFNTGTRDYFGLQVQNRALNRPLSVVGVQPCQSGVASWLCVNWKPDQVGLRDLDSGAVVDDAEFLLRDPSGIIDNVNRYRIMIDNSLIWSNALFQIRTAFAGEDGGNMVTSKAAVRFDRIVLNAAVKYASNAMSLADGAAAVRQSAVDLKASSAEIDLITQQFTISQLCEGCATPPGAPTRIAASSVVENRPSIAAAGVVFIRQASATPKSFSTEAVVTAPDGSDAQVLDADGEGTDFVQARGDYVLERRYALDSGDWRGLFLTKLSTGTTERLDDVSGWSNPAVSAATVAWATLISGSNVLHARATAGGPVSELSVPGRVVQLAVDAKTVAFELQNGTIGVWDIASKRNRVLGQFGGIANDADLKLLNGLPGAMSLSGNRLAVLSVQKVFSGPYDVTVFDIQTGKSTLLSSNALAAGIAIDGDTVVWAEIVGNQPSAIATLYGTTAIDSDLVGYSFKTGASAVLLTERGQQGFPSLAGGRLAWQDSASLSDDIAVADLPAGW